MTIHKKLDNKKNEIKTRDDVINSATEFYKKKTGISSHISKNTLHSEVTSQDIDTPPIDDLETIKHIKKMENDKSPEPDDIHKEALKTDFLL